MSQEIRKKKEGFLLILVRLKNVHNQKFRFTDPFVKSRETVFKRNVQKQANYICRKYNKDECIRGEMTQKLYT